MSEQNQSEPDVQDSPRPKAEPSEYLRPDVLDRMLSEAEWGTAVVMVEAPVEGRDSLGVQFQICPFCAVPVLMDAEGYPFRQMHIDSHVDTMRMVWLALGWNG